MSNPNRRQTRANAQQFIDTLKPLQHPNSEKVYLTGSRADINVAMRQVNQTETVIGGTDAKPIKQANPPIMVYDCAGAYSDPLADINVRQGLAKIHQSMLDERQDTG